MKVGDVSVTVTESYVSWTAGLAIDADGAPNAYNADSAKGIDRLDNAKKSNGKWCGVVCNSAGQPYVQGASDPCPGFYISQTALQDHNYPERDPRRYVDSGRVPYISVPPELLKEGIKLGDVAWVDYRGVASVAAVVAEVGPKGKVGEGSVALAAALGILSDPRHGGCSSGVAVTVFLGSSRGWPRTLSDMAEQVESLRGFL